MVVIKNGQQNFLLNQQISFCSVYNIFYGTDITVTNSAFINNAVGG